MSTVFTTALPTFCEHHNNSATAHASDGRTLFLCCVGVRWPGNCRVHQDSWRADRASCPCHHCNRVGRNPVADLRSGLFALDTVLRNTSLGNDDCRQSRPSWRLKPAHQRYGPQAQDRLESSAQLRDPAFAEITERLVELPEKNTKTPFPRRLTVERSDCLITKMTPYRLP
jgi:hypothetical protein